MRWPDCYAGEADSKQCASIVVFDSALRAAAIIEGFEPVPRAG